jgi:amidase
MPTQKLDARHLSRREVFGLGWGSPAVVVPPQSHAPAALAPAADANFLFPQSNDPATELIYMSATRLAQSIRERKVSSEEAVKACLTRIADVNPKLNAVVQLCAERALVEAKEADGLLAKGKLKGPLHGVPMTIKDSFDTAGVVSTGGTLGRKDYIPARDAAVVARLRAAGAILLGKTNTPEFTLSFNTTNLVYGATRNPYGLNFQPSGSSGGAAAIVASGGSPFDIGSDFAGSIREPCHACGIAGIKPTSGRVPRSGHIVGYGGAFDAFQQVGPMARKVEDLALILPIIAGPDYLDAAIVPVPLKNPGEVGLRGLRVAYYTTNGEIDPVPEIQQMVEKCAGLISNLGAKVTQSRPPMMKEAGEIRWRLHGADGGATVTRLVKKAGTRQTSPVLIMGGTMLKPSEFTALVEKLDACRSAMLAFMEDFDLILCPVNAQPAKPLSTEPVSPRGNYTSIYNITGWPVAVVRAGISPEGLPLGIQIVGRPWAEEVVLAAAAQLESKTGGWQKPPI